MKLQFKLKRNVFKKHPLMLSRYFAKIFHFQVTRVHFNYSYLECDVIYVPRHIRQRRYCRE